MKFVHTIRFVCRVWRSFGRLMRLRRCSVRDSHVRAMIAAKCVCAVACASETNRCTAYYIAVACGGGARTRKHTYTHTDTAVHLAYTRRIAYICMYIHVYTSNLSVSTYGRKHVPVVYMCRVFCIRYKYSCKWFVFVIYLRC